jgi:NifB/MoaA-like Fe-S oxidoreductase
MADATPQLNDGVGTVDVLTQGLYALQHRLPPALSHNRHVLIATGQLAAMALQPFAQALNAVQGLHVDVQGIKNRFWGQQIDVAGLLTGQDVLHALQQESLTGYACIIIPSVMLKHGTDMFLDGQTVHGLSDTLGKPFVVIHDTYSAEELVTACLGQPLP